MIPHSKSEFSLMRSGGEVALSTAVAVHEPLSCWRSFHVRGSQLRCGFLSRGRCTTSVERAHLFDIVVSLSAVRKILLHLLFTT